MGSCCTRGPKEEAESLSDLSPTRTGKRSSAYSFTSEKKVEEDVGPLLAFTAVEQFGELPKARRGHTLNISCGYMILYGGFSTQSQVFGDIRILDLYTGEWMTLNVRGSPPPSRCTHTAVMHEHNIYVYGIHSGDCMDIFQLNLDTESWHRLTSWGDLPPSRGGHSAVVWGEEMYVFAGETVAAVTNDLYSFNFGSKRWKIISHSNTDFAVMPRRDHTAVTYEGKMYVYGGFNDVNERMDILCFEFETQEWSSIPAVGPQPPFRGAHSATVWRGCMLVYGGMYENVHRNDLWILDLKSFRWREVHFAKCRSDLARLTPETLTCPTNVDNLPQPPPGKEDQAVYVADSLQGVFGLRRRRTVSREVCPEPQAYVPETVSQGQPVVPCAMCYHRTLVWNDTLYIWGGGDENVNYSECYALFLADLMTSMGLSDTEKEVEPHTDKGSGFKFDESLDPYSATTNGNGTGVRKASTPNKGVKFADDLKEDSLPQGSPNSLGASCNNGVTDQDVMKGVSLKSDGLRAYFDNTLAELRQEEGGLGQEEEKVQEEKEEKVEEEKVEEEKEAEEEREKKPLEAYRFGQPGPEVTVLESEGSESEPGEKVQPPPRRRSTSPEALKRRLSAQRLSLVEDEVQPAVDSVNVRRKSIDVHSVMRPQRSPDSTDVTPAATPNKDDSARFSRGFPPNSQALEVAFEGNMKSSDSTESTKAGQGSAEAPAKEQDTTQDTKLQSPKPKKSSSKNSVRSDKSGKSGNSDKSGKESESKEKKQGKEGRRKSDGTQTLNSLKARAEELKKKKAQQAASPRAKKA